MVIALAQIGSSLATDSGGIPQFELSIVTSADDGTNSASTSLIVFVPATSTTAQFNEAIVSAVETWVNGQHSWTLDRKNLYFQPFANGS